MDQGARQFPASAKKLRKARAEGDVSKSRELSSALALFLSGLALAFPVAKFSYLLVFFQRTMESAGESAGATQDFSSNTMLISLRDSAAISAYLVGPVLCAVLISTIGAEGVQVGVQFCWNVLAPKAERVSVGKGLGRLLRIEPGKFSPLSFLLEAGKFLGLVVVSLLVIAFSVMTALRQVMKGGADELSGLIELSAHRCAAMSVIFAALLLAWGLVDSFVQRYRRLVRLRMDREELKRELRESEGDPQLRSLRKSAHAAMLRSGTLNAVRNARLLVIGEKQRSSPGSAAKE